MYLKKLIHNLYKDKINRLIDNHFIYLLNLKMKLLKEMLMYQVILLLIELLFNLLIDLLEKKFKFNKHLKLEKNFNLLFKIHKYKIILVLIMFKYLLKKSIHKELYNHFIIEKMFN